MPNFADALASQSTPLQQVALSILCAYLISHAIGALYAWMRRGQEYSRSFVQALVIGGIVGAMIMLAIGNSLARGVGIVGALALIRFRTNLRDPLDMIFIFAAFAAGIAAGAGNIATGMVGTVIFIMVVGVMQLAGVGSSQIESELRVRVLGNDGAGEAAIRDVLRERTVGFALLKRRVLKPLAKGEAKPERSDAAAADTVGADVIGGAAPPGDLATTPAPPDKPSRPDKPEKPDKVEQRLAFRVVLKSSEDEPALMRALQAIPSVSEAALSLESSTAQNGGGGGDDD